MSAHPYSLTVHILTCAHCGTQIQRRSATHRYCGECRDQVKRDAHPGPVGRPPAPSEDGASIEAAIERHYRAIRSSGRHRLTTEDCWTRLTSLWPMGE